MKKKKIEKQITILAKAIITIQKEINELEKRTKMPVHFERVMPVTFIQDPEERLMNMLRDFGEN